MSFIAKTVPEKNNLKKALSFTLCIILIVCISGCYIGTAAKERRKAHKAALKFFKYLQSEDIDKLTAQFSKDARYNNDLEQDWEDFYYAVDGRIESYGRLRVTDRSVWYDKGKMSHCIIIVKFEDVVTNKGVTYDELSYEHVITDGDPDAIGITVLHILDEDEKTVAVVGGNREE